MTSEDHPVHIPHGERSARDVLLKPVNAAWVVLCFTGALALSVYISFNQIGPRWFWASDACPEPNVTCGMLPAGVMISTLGAAVLIVFGLHIFNRLEDD